MGSQGSWRSYGKGTHEKAGRTRIHHTCECLPDSRTSLFGLAPARSPLDAIFLYASLIVGVGGQRKRDGVESTAIRICQSKGMGKGEASSALANWRSIASIVAPMLFGKAGAWGSRKGVPGAPFLCVAALSLAAEAVFRTIRDV